MAGASARSLELLHSEVRVQRTEKYFLRHQRPIIKRTSGPLSDWNRTWIDSRVTGTSPGSVTGLWGG